MESSPPESYDGCAAAIAIGTTPSPWKSSVPAGITTYTQYYCLRVDWNDAPGTFVSTTTFSVSQK